MFLFFPRLEVVVVAGGVSVVVSFTRVKRSSLPRPILIFTLSAPVRHTYFPPRFPFPLRSSTSRIRSWFTLPLSDKKSVYSPSSTTAQERDAFEKDYFGSVGGRRCSRGTNSSPSFAMVFTKYKNIYFIRDMF